MSEPPISTSPKIDLMAAGEVTSWAANPEPRVPKAWSRQGPTTPDFAHVAPTHFPFDTDWMTLHHHKGQLGRAQPRWARDLIRSRLAAGEPAAELAVHCWIMGVYASFISQHCFDELLQACPEARSAALDPAAATLALALVGTRFEESAETWIPPLDSALRGWTHTQPDEKIQAASRGKFAILAGFCFRASAVGMPRALELSALRDPDWLASLPGGFRGPSSFVHFPISCVGLLVRAMHEEVELSETRSSDFEARAPRLLAVCALSQSPRGYLAALAGLEVRVVPRARLSGLAAAASVRYAGESGGPNEHIRAAVEPLRGQDPSLAPSSERSADAQLGADPRAHVLALKIQHDRQLAQASRARFALWHGATTSVRSEKTHPGSIRAFAEAALGCNLLDSEATGRANGLIAAAAGGKQHVAGAALVLAQAFEDAGGSLVPAVETSRAVWESHIEQYRRMGAPNIPTGFALRHASLSLRFPHPELEATSVALASASPRVVAALESIELSRCTLRYEPCPEDSCDSGEASAAAPSERLAELPSRKMRL